MAKRPLIAVPSRFSETASAIRYRAELGARALISGLYAAGAEPLLVHPHAPDAQIDVEAVAERLSFADGIVLPGGGDLSHRWSSQEAHPSLYDVDEEQDAFDLAIASYALDQGIPLLAICRGLQVVTTLLKGELHLDMAEVPEIGKDHRHLRHEISLSPGSRMASTFGDSLHISCYHHQAIKTLGAGMVCTAQSADSVVEAVEMPESKGWFLGVQWHPEDTWDSDPHQLAVLKELVDASRG